MTNIKKNGKKENINDEQAIFNRKTKFKEKTAL